MEYCWLLLTGDASIKLDKVGPETDLNDVRQKAKEEDFFFFFFI